MTNILDDPRAHPAISRPPPHRPLRQTLLAGIAVIGFAVLGAVMVYFVTEGLLLLRGQSQQAFVGPK